VLLNISVAFVKLEISQLPISWLKAVAAQNIESIVVTLLTFQLPIFWLKAWVDIDGNGSDADLTGWDVSHVTDASRAFFDATTFNQNIGNWDVRNVKLL
jgi:hypothetical protein